MQVWGQCVAVGAPPPPLHSQRRRHTHTLPVPPAHHQTVEHLFYYSFVVKEGKATVKLDKDGQPVVGLCNEVGVSTIGMSQEDMQEAGCVAVQLWCGRAGSNPLRAAPQCLGLCHSLVRCCGAGPPWWTRRGRGRVS